MKTTSKSTVRAVSVPSGGAGLPLGAPSVVAQLTALKTTPTPALKTKWRELFGKEPPPYNRRFLESRLAYRIQELAYSTLR